MTLIADVFPKIPDPKNMVRVMSKKPCFRRPLHTENIANQSKQCSKLNGNNSTKVINHCEDKSIGKKLF